MPIAISPTSARPVQAAEQRVAVTDLADAVAATLQQKRGAHFLHEVGTIVRGRAVDPKPYGNAGLFQITDWTRA